MEKLDTLKRRRDFLLELCNESDDELVKARTKIIDELNKNINEIEESDKIIGFSNIVKSNGWIELRKVIDKEYMIFLCNQNIAIGYIKYSGYHCSYDFGDVSYYIYSEHRGNNYAYQALCLLGEKLKEDGIDDFWISAKKDNIASIKTILKYDGKIILSNGDTSLFECKTRLLSVAKNKSI